MKRNTINSAPGKGSESSSGSTVMEWCNPMRIHELACRSRAHRHDQICTPKLPQMKSLPVPGFRELHCNERRGRSIAMSPQPAGSAK
jgi:hypothetical protein